MFSNQIFPGNGSSLTAEDFKNGAKLTEELKSQDNSTKRAHFEQAMGYHQVSRSRKENVDNKSITGGRHSCSKKQ